VRTPLTIDDPRDPRLADYVGLTDAALRQRFEGEVGVLIAEGELVIRELIRSPYPVRSVLVTPARYERLAADLTTVDAPVYLAGRDVMKAAVGFDIHRGAVAAADRLPLPDPAAVVAGASRLAVLEGLNDHENLGALFRNAAALGVDAVLLSPTCADPLYRRAVRVSLGHVLHIPFARLTPWPAGLASLTAAGFEVLALTPRPTAEALQTVVPTSTRVAILLGAEGPGLSGPALEAVRRWVRIPMADGVDSLNVATAAAIAFHHLG